MSFIYNQLNCEKKRPIVNCYPTIIKFQTLDAQIKKKTKNDLLKQKLRIS